MAKLLKSLIIIFVFAVCPLISDELWEPVPGPLGGPIYDITTDSMGNIYALHTYWHFPPIIDEAINVISGVYVSSDSGTTWEYSYFGGTGAVCRIFCFDGHTLMIPSGEGTIFISYNQGKTWLRDQINNIKPVTNLFKTSDGVLFAALGNYIYRKFPDGAWESLKTLFDVTYFVSDFVELSPGEIVISSCSMMEQLSGGVWGSAHGKGLFKTTNYGKDWVKFKEDAEDLNITYTMKLNSDSSIIAATSTGIFILPKGLESYGSWLSKSDFGIDGDFRVLSMEYVKDGKWLISVDQSGVFMVDGGKPVRITEGVLTKHFNKMLVHNNGYIYGCSEFVGMFRSTDNGNSWAMTNKGMGSSAIYFTFSTKNGTIFIVTNGGSVYRKSMNDSDWILNNVSDDNTPISKMMETGRGALLALTNDAIYRSGDRGESWIPVWRFNSVSGYHVMEISPEGNIFVGDAFKSDGLLKSTDDGLTWKQASSDFLPNGVMNIIFDDNGLMYIIDIDAHLFISQNDGKTWAYLNDFKNYQNNIEVYSGYYYNSNLFFPTNLGLLYLDREINKFKKVDIPPLNYHRLGMIADGALFLDSYEGLQRSWNGFVNWFALPPPEQTTFNSLSLLSDGRILTGTSKGLFKSKLKNSELKFLSLKLDPSSELYKFHGDSISIYISLTDDKLNKIQKADLTINDTLLHKNSEIDIIDGQAVYEFTIPETTRRDRYFLDFFASAPGYLNSANKSLLITVNDYVKWFITPDTVVVVTPGDVVEFRAHLTTNDYVNINNARVSIYHILKQNNYILQSQIDTDVNGKADIEYEVDGKHRFGLDSLLLKAFHPQLISASASNFYPYKVYFYVVNPASTEIQTDDNVSMLVSPNPATDYFDVIIQAPENRYGKLSVFDMFGREVINQSEIMINSAWQRFTYSTSLLASGTYLVTLTAGKSRIISKLVITK